MQEPTVYLVIEDSTIALDEKGEVLETVEYFDNGDPDWSWAGICDHRGAGGQAGFEALHTALLLAEENAKLCECTIHRLKT